MEPRLFKWVFLEKFVAKYIVPTVFILGGFVIPVMLYLLTHPMDTVYLTRHKLWSSASVPLLTLVTTLKLPHDDAVANDMLHNWTSFPKDEVHAVLYDNGSTPGYLLQRFTQNDWRIVKMPNTHSDGTPLFIDMLKDASTRFNSHFYAYADSNVLFMENLLDTLKFLAAKLNQNKSTIIVGNVTAPHIDENQVLLSKPLGLDYDKCTSPPAYEWSYLIITNIKEFPWHNVSVVGKGPLLIRDFVADALLKNVGIIDISKTSLVLQQKNALTSQLARESNNDREVDYYAHIINPVIYETALISSDVLQLNSLQNSSQWLMDHGLNGLKSKVISLPRESRPLLTLFTTFRPLASKFSIHVNVIHNWALFIPHIMPVLFNTSTDPELIRIALEHGWKVLPEPKLSPDGLPYFRDMFLKVKDAFNSTYYGFSNGDILYTEGLNSTMLHLRPAKSILGRTLIVGARYNFNYRNQTITGFGQVEALIKKESKIYGGDAEDYFFIADADFPWSCLKDIVIGRPAYDNYVVAKALERNVAVIDATSTNPALHQTGTDGNKAGHSGKGVGWNKKVIGKFNYSQGFLSQINYKTRFTDGKVAVTMKNGTPVSFEECTQSQKEVSAETPVMSYSVVEAGVRDPKMDHAEQ